MCILFCFLYQVIYDVYSYGSEIYLKTKKTKMTQTGWEHPRSIFSVETMLSGWINLN